MFVVNYDQKHLLVGLKDIKICPHNDFKIQQYLSIFYAIFVLKVVACQALQKFFLRFVIDPADSLALKET